MKNIIVTIFLFLSFSCFSANDWPFESFEGDGTESNPFQISTVSQLDTFAMAVNYNVSATKGYFILNNDIDLYEIKSSLKIIGYGSKNVSFNGKFNGNNKTINVDLDFAGGSSQNAVGLFGRVGTTGEIKDLTVSGKVLSYLTQADEKFVGGLVGENNGKIINCTSLVVIHAEVDGWGKWNPSAIAVGGVVGLNNGEINKCYSRAFVNGEVLREDVAINQKRVANVGGIAGRNSATILYSVSSGTVSGRAYASQDDGTNIGGVVGWNDANAFVRYCYNVGDLLCEGDWKRNLGGVVGVNFGTVEYSANSGAIYVTGQQSSGRVFLGGVIAQNAGYANYLYNVNNVKKDTETTERWQIGTIVANSLQGSSLLGCFFDAQMSAIDDSNASTIQKRITTDMVGASLRTGISGEGWTDANWDFSDGLYPSPKGVNSIVNLGIAPAFLLSSSSTSYDDILDVKHNFSVSRLNGVKWRARGNVEKLEFTSTLINDRELVRVVQQGAVTLEAELNGVIRSIPLNIFSLPEDEDTIIPFEDETTIRLYVTEAGGSSAVKNGSAWEFALSGDYLQEAIDYLAAVNTTRAKEVWIGTGKEPGYVANFFPTAVSPLATSPESTSINDLSFIVREGVDIYGNFGGFEDSKDARTSRQLFTTRLNGKSFSYNVVVCGDGSTEFTKRTFLDGVSIGYGASSPSASLAQQNGAGVVTVGNVIVRNCIVFRNSAAGNGGGILLRENARSISNYIYDNTAAFGGGIYTEGASSKSTESSLTRVIFNTIVNNKATGVSNGAGGGLYNKGNVNVLASVIWQNKNNDDLVDNIKNNDANLVSYVNTAADRGVNDYVANIALYSTNGTDADIDGSNIFYPRFKDPTADYPFVHDAHRLKANSSLRNRSNLNQEQFEYSNFDVTGVQQHYPDGLSMDLDIGAFESIEVTPNPAENGRRFYVSRTPKGRMDGSSWDNATAQFQAAMDYFSDKNNDDWDNKPYEILVSEGTYLPRKRPSTSTDIRDASFEVYNNIKLYGGFRGNENQPYPLTDDNDTRQRVDLDGNGIVESYEFRYLTFLDGRAYENEQHVSNVYHVVRSLDTKNRNLRNVLDGFVVRYGVANGTATTDLTGMTDDEKALYSYESERNRGGGVFSKTQMLIKNCIVAYNKAESFGGGLYIESGRGAAHLSLFTNNEITADLSGAQRDQYHGSAMFFVPSFDVSYTSELFSCLIADNRGGQSAVLINNAKAINNSFVRNSISGGAGAVIVAIGADTYMYNNVVWGNSIAGDNKRTVYLAEDSETLVGVDRNNFQNNAIYGYVFGGNAETSFPTNNIYLSSKNEEDETDAELGLMLAPRFVDPFITSSSVGNYSLNCNSPLINRGYGAWIPLNDVRFSCDLAYKSRIYFGQVDIGAYEQHICQPTDNAFNLVFESPKAITPSVKDSKGNAVEVAVVEEVGNVSKYSFTQALPRETYSIVVGEEEYSFTMSSLPEYIKATDISSFTENANVELEVGTSVTNSTPRVVNNLMLDVFGDVNYKNYSSSLLISAPLTVKDGLCVQLDMTDNNQWVYMSLPFDIDIATGIRFQTSLDIVNGTETIAVPEVDFYSQTYSSYKRATQGEGTANWDIIYNGIIRAGTGFLFAKESSDSYRLYALNPNDLDFNQKEFNLSYIDAKLYGRTDWDSGWNMIGTPFSAPYLYKAKKDANAPIGSPGPPKFLYKRNDGRWAGGYELNYDPVFDEEELIPYTAYLTQVSGEVHVVLPAEGFEFSMGLDDESRDAFGLTLTKDVNVVDRVGWVFTPSASRSLVYNEDAVKVGTGNDCMWSPFEGKNYIYNSLPFEGTKMDFDLTVRCDANSDVYTLSARTNSAIDYDIFIKENNTNMWHNLEQAVYQLPVSASRTRTFNVSIVQNKLVTNTDPASASRFLMYSNNNTIFLEGVDNNAVVSVYSVAGMKVSEYTGSSNYTIDSLEKGIYAVVVQTAEGMFTKKVSVVK